MLRSGDGHPYVPGDPPDVCREQPDGEWRHSTSLGVRRQDEDRHHRLPGLDREGALHHHGGGRAGATTASAPSSAATPSSATTTTDAVV